MTEFLLLVYMTLPLLDLPHLRYYMPWWGTGEESYSTLYKETCERLVLIGLALTWAGLLY